MNNKDTEWEKAEALVKKLYPYVDFETRLRLMNMYFSGYQEGLKFAGQVLDKTYEE